MELLIAGLSLATVYFAWNYVWYRLLLGVTRARLTDVRCDASRWFREHGYTDENREYLVLRAIINANIRMAEETTFSSFLIFLFFEDKNTSEKKNSDYLETSNAEISKYINNVKMKISHIIFAHMIFRNIFLTFCFIIFAFLCALYIIGKVLYNSIGSLRARICRDVSLKNKLPDMTVIYNYIKYRCEMIRRNFPPVEIRVSGLAVSLLLILFTILNRGGLINSRMGKYLFTPNAGTPGVCVTSILRDKA